MKKEEEATAASTAADIALCNAAAMGNSQTGGPWPLSPRSVEAPWVGRLSPYCV